MAKTAYETVEEYIDQLPDDIQLQLRHLRKIILDVIPDAQERISWGAPTYYDHGYLLQFAANKQHIGFYTSPSCLKHFKQALANYQTNDKNTVHFPYGQVLPESLIKDMIRFRLLEKEAGTSK